jgi:hypothetical protein
VAKKPPNRGHGARSTLTHRTKLLERISIPWRVSGVHLCSTTIPVKVVFHLVKGCISGYNFLRRNG